MKRKIIIDTDPGIDDAMAIFYALESPELDLVGLTTVFGNATLPVTTQNALRLMEIADRRDIRVSAGAERPLMSPYTGNADVVHGTDSQGNLHLPPPALQPTGKHAVQFLVEMIKAHPGEITLVPVAPLTNIALLLLMEPGIDKLIREIVLMGGSAFALGNVTPAAEANIWNDPEAADIVFGASCAVTMIGLDVTEKIFMSGEALEQIGQIDNARAKHLARILPVYREFHRTHYREDGIYVHDSTTITYLRDPSLFTTVQAPIRVELTGLGRGKTWLAMGRSEGEAAWQGRPPVTVCLTVNAEQAIRMEMERMAV